MYPPRLKHTKNYLPNSPYICTKQNNMIKTIDLYPYSVESIIVSYNRSKEDLIKFIDDTWESEYIREGFKELIETINPVLDGIYHRGKVIDSIGEDGSYFSILVLTDKFDPTQPEDMITLAHEVLHVLQSFLPRYLDRDIEHEAEAYLHSHIMRQCISHLK